MDTLASLRTNDRVYIDCLKDFQKDAIQWVVSFKNAEKVCLSALFVPFRLQYDAPEPDAPEPFVRQYGDSRYPGSGISQWLNSNQRNWFVPASAHDAPPNYANIPGFLRPAPKFFQDAIIPYVI